MKINLNFWPKFPLLDLFMETNAARTHKKEKKGKAKICRTV